MQGENAFNHADFFENLSSGGVLFRIISPQAHPKKVFKHRIGSSCIHLKYK